MRRTITAMLMAAAVSGCMSSNHGADMTTTPTIRASGEYLPRTVPGVTGPWGEPLPIAAPYNSAPPLNAFQARQMMSQNVPLEWAQMGGVSQASAQMPGGMPMPPNGMPMMPGSGMLSPPGVPFSPPMMTPGGGGMPPANMPMPGGGMMPPGFRPTSGMGAMPGPGPMPNSNPANIGRTQVRFTGPDGMRIAWLVQGADGKPSFSPPVVETPGRYNYTQASIYRLKLSGIKGRPGLEVYPTLEVVPCNGKTEAFLAHSAVPLEFTAEDFREIAEGKYLVKVIYLPDPQFQELAATGTDEIISTRLEPGADPIMEAQRRGSILLVVRMGNVDQEAPNTPPLDTGSPGASAAANMPLPGMVQSPVMEGPIAPGSATASSTVPSYLRTGPSSGMPQVQPGASTAPSPPVPALPSIPVPPTPPSVRGPLSQLPGPSAVQPATGIQLPELPPILPMAPNKN